MNKIIRLSGLLAFTCAIMISCNKPASKDTDDKDSTSYHFNDTLLVNQENPKIIEYRAFIHQLDSTDVASALLATDKFKTLFANQSTGLCDSAYVVYQNLMDTIDLKINEKLGNDTTNYSAIYMGEPVSKKIKDFQTYLQKNGFKLSSSEGTVYIEQDRSFVVKNLSTMMSEPMKAYLLQIEKENREGFSEDAAITIKPKQHVDRIIWYENFIKANAGFILIENCKNYKKAYLSYLLQGIDNTPLYSDAEQMTLEPYYATAFKYLLKTYPEAETTLLVTPYYEAIKQKQKATINDLIKKYTIKGLIFSLN